MPEQVTFQDALFSPERVVQRTLESGTILQLTLAPLPGERVRVLKYRRKAKGERWVTVKAEAGRTVAWQQLGLRASFESVFGTSQTRGKE
jgi:hypothetical protein